MGDPLVQAPHASGNGLVAIALIIRAKHGPRFVFHYPPHPAYLPPKEDTRFGTELDSETAVNDDAEEDEDSDLDDGHQSHSIPAEPSHEREKSSKKSSAQDIDEDGHITFTNGQTLVPWEHMGEFSTAHLESILTPSRDFHKKLFLLNLDPLQFVSYPMHIREDGTWKKKKSKKFKKSKQGSEEEESVEGDKNETKAESDDGDDHGGMTMFNIVFVLNLPIDEEDDRAHEVYDHVIKKFSKALSHAQASCGYVWKESEMILSMKEKAREDRRPMNWLWSNVLVKSTLAAAIKDVFIKIANDKIATIRLALKPPLELSLHVPTPPFLLNLPAAVEKSMPGLMVTTANPYADEEGNIDLQYLNKHFALLLLDDEDKIVTQIQSDNVELAAPLLECIRLSKPTLSFLQVAQTNSVELSSLLMLAQHLIYWRKAIAIPPLHQRETYVISPNANHHALGPATIAWTRTFPFAPPLKNFLAQLSAAPRPYKTFFPSKDHRETYIDMLGWLIRGGWVTQLHTFAYIMVWPEIIYEVSYQMKEDAIKKRNEPKSPQTAFSSSTSNSNSESEKQIDPSAPLTTEQAAEHARLDRLAAKEMADNIAEATEFAKKPRPVATAHPSTNKAAHLQDIEPYVIRDPHKLSHEDSMYIAALGKRYEDPKVKEAFFKLARYFNGIDSLEMICLREGVKRKETWAMLLNFQEHLISMKHW